MITLVIITVLFSAYLVWEWRTWPTPEEQRRRRLARDLRRSTEK